MELDDGLGEKGGRILSVRSARVDVGRVEGIDDVCA